MARSQIIEDLLAQFVVPAKETGIKRAIGTLYRTLANNLAQQLTDSGELVEALTLLRQSKDRAMVGGLNPRPVPNSAAQQQPTPRIRNMAPAPSIEVGEAE